MSDDVIDAAAKVIAYELGEHGTVVYRIARALADAGLLRHPHIKCASCGGLIHYQDCPTGGWWIHVIHPDDDHDAEPAKVIDPHTDAIVQAAREWVRLGRAAPDPTYLTNVQHAADALIAAVDAAREAQAIAYELGEYGTVVLSHRLWAEVLSRDPHTDAIVDTEGDTCDHCSCWEIDQGKCCHCGLIAP